MKIIVMAVGIFFSVTPLSYADQSLRVGVYNSEPLVFIEEYQAKGLYVDILDHIAEKEGWTIEYVPGTWQECLDRLESGKIDLLPSIAYSEKRAEKFDFTQSFLFVDWGSVYRNKKKTIDTVFDLQGKTISALKGSIYTQEFKRMLDQFGIHCAVIEKDEYTQVFESVHQKEADAGVCANVYGTRIEGLYHDIRRTHIVFAPVKIRFAVRKDTNTYLIAIIDNYIKILKYDKQSVYYELYDKWLRIYHPNHIIPQWLMVTTIFSVGAVILFFLFIVILKRQVGLKTAALAAANKSLKQSEEIFRMSFENANIGACLLNTDGRFILVNRQMCDIFGYSRQEFESMTVNDITHPDYRNVTPNFIMKAASGEITHDEFEKLYIHKQGGIICGKVSSSLVRNRQGMPNFFISHVQDITERKNMENALQESERLKSELIDKLNESQHIGMIGSWDWDIRSNKVWWSDETYRIFGVTPEEYTPSFEGNAAFIHPDDLENYGKLFGHSLKTGAPLNYDVRVITKDGIVKYCCANGRVIFDDSGNAIRFVGTMADFTERRKSEEERKKLESRLRHAQSLEAIGTLAGGIAHDFNNILFPIIGYSEMTSDELPQDSRAYQNLQEILKAAMRAKELVNQILTFSRQREHDKIIMKIQPVVKEALKLIRSTLPTTIELFQNIDPDCDPVIADPTQIHQIVMNLCTNAYHAMQDNGGKLEVTLAEVGLGADDISAYPGTSPGTYLKLSVSDTGVGIPKDILERIFDPFFTTKPVGKGTGLGLSVVHGIVTQMGGHIRVYSEPGKGTVFHVYMPAIIETACMSDSPSCSEILPTGSERILLADDEEPILRMLQQMLENLGYRVTGYSRSMQAFGAFQSEPGSFDLVITDMTMPDMTGAQLAQKILEIRADMPIILCTGFSEQISGEKSEKLGIRGYLMKPVIRSEMAKMIRKVLKGL